jgi:hypothetical protein
VNKTSVDLSSEDAARLEMLASRNFALAGSGQGTGSSVAELFDEVLLGGFGV